MEQRRTEHSMKDHNNGMGSDLWLISPHRKEEGGGDRGEGSEEGRRTPLSLSEHLLSLPSYTGPHTGGRRREDTPLPCHRRQLHRATLHLSLRLSPLCTPHPVPSSHTHTAHLPHTYLLLPACRPPLTLQVGRMPTCHTLQHPHKDMPHACALGQHLLLRLRAHARCACPRHACAVRAPTAPPHFAHAPHPTRRTPATTTHTCPCHTHATHLHLPRPSHSTPPTCTPTLFYHNTCPTYIPATVLWTGFFTCTACHLLSHMPFCQWHGDWRRGTLGCPGEHTCLWEEGGEGPFQPGKCLSCATHSTMTYKLRWHCLPPHTTLGCH